LIIVQGCIFNLSGPEDDIVVLEIVAYFAGIGG
jgi:hypothetical protein